MSFIEMASVSNDGYIENIDSRKLAEVKKGYTHFRNRDIIFAKITPCMENGKCAYAEGLENNFGFGSTEFYVLRADEALIKPKLIYYFVKQKSFRVEAEKNMTGTSGHRRVPKLFVENYVFPVPSLAEQKKAILEVEALETEIAAIEASLANIEAEKERILKTYLE